MGTLGFGTLEGVGNWVDLGNVLVELEKHCFEVGCFGGSVGFVVVVVVDNWVGFEEGLDSKVAYQ